MKTHILYLLVIICTPFLSQAQLPNLTTADSTKQTQNAPMNLLDAQADVFSDIFGNLGGMEEFQGIDGFMDLVAKMNASPEMKTKLTEQYELYANSLDPTKKEQVKIQLNELLAKAMKEGQEKDKQNP